MRFKEFMQSEALQGLYGPVGGVDISKLLIKQVKSPLGSGNVIKKMLSSGPKISKPARPAGPSAGPIKPMTVPSVLKNVK